MAHANDPDWLCVLPLSLPLFPLSLSLSLSFCLSLSVTLSSIHLLMHVYLSRWKQLWRGYWRRTGNGWVTNLLSTGQRKELFSQGAQPMADLQYTHPMKQYSKVKLYARLRWIMSGSKVTYLVICPQCRKSVSSVDCGYPLVLFQFWSWYQDIYVSNICETRRI